MHVRIGNGEGEIVEIYKSMYGVQGSECAKYWDCVAVSVSYFN